jgi:predicted nuclease of restriction endonuclease-like (RecB) superfamily
VEKMSKIVSKDYLVLLGEIKQRIRSAQYDALKAVNKELISLYWDIGKMIVEWQKGESWGKSVVEQLSYDLQSEFPGIKGFSNQNLWYMRQFYSNYIAEPKLQPMVGEIGWTHNLIIMANCKNDLEREFYIRMARKFGWSKNVIIHQIENQTYEKTMLNQTKFEKNLSVKIQEQSRGVRRMCSQVHHAMQGTFLIQYHKYLIWASNRNPHKPSF